MKFNVNKKSETTCWKKLVIRPNHAWPINLYDPKENSCKKKIE